MADKQAVKKRERRELKRVAKLVEAEVSYFNGWHVSDTSMRNACFKAAEKIMKYLRD